VELLEVGVDVQAGTVTVRWSRYQGPGFVTYRVERRRVDETTFIPVEWVRAINDTVYTDTTLLLSITPSYFSFFYQVVVEASGQDWPSDRTERVSFPLAPVQLLAGTPDPRTGTIRLTWSRYAGPGFESYEIRRRVADEAEEISLKRRTSRDDTTFVDEEVLQGVDYTYTVVVRALGQDLPPGNALERRLTLPSVTLSEPTFTSATASASLRWTLYLGPRFQEYRVERGTAPVSQTVAKISNRTQTAFVDSGLVGNTEHVYRVVVVTSRGEKIPSNDQRGGIHPLMDSWSVEVEEGEYGRLYVEPNDRIVLLLSKEERVRLLTFNTDGNPLGEQVLLTGRRIPSRSVSTTLTPEGTRLLLLASGKTLALLSFDRDGDPIMGDERVLFPDVFPEPLGESKRTVVGQIELSATPFRSPGSTLTPFAAFDNVRVSQDGRPLFEDDFEEGNSKGWKNISANPTIFGNGWISSTKNFWIIKADSSQWRDFRLEVDMVGQEMVAAITIGNFSSFSRFNLLFSFTNQPRARLIHGFSPPPGSDLRARTDSFSESFPLVDGVPHHLGLELIDGRVRVSVKSPVLWDTTGTEDARWGSLIVVEGGNRILFEDGRPYVTPQPIFGSSELSAPVGEIRAWEWGQGASRRSWAGICLPRENMIRFGWVLLGGRLRWPVAGLGGITFGGTVGHASGEFLYPLSFDASPDGRLFVLDAGNARIQVFDGEGDYITQWGSKGSGEDQFNFGSGGVPEDFAGSVAVDDRGYIYILDMGNRRIQKFAP
jgi:hypothetical protein